MPNVEALYCDLDEAVEILSKRLPTHNLTTKKLIKFIAQFNIPVHIYGFGFSITGDFNSLQQYSKPKDDFLHRVEKDLSTRNTETGSLFQIPNEIITLFQFHNTLPVPQFNDVIPVATLQYANSAIESLRLTMEDFKDKEEKFEIFSLYAYIEANYHYDSGSDELSENFINKIEDLSEVFINCIKTKPKFTIGEFYKVDEKEYNTCLNISHFTVNFNDLILIRKNLNQLESYLSGNELFDPHFTENISQQQRSKIRRPGVSLQKIHAQLAAKTLATYFWNHDTNNKIKIKEMAIQVYAELNQTEHREQLPNQSVSLKKWIENIAPEYAREPGRPK